MRYFYITYETIKKDSCGCFAMRCEEDEPFSILQAKQVATQLLNKDRHSDEHLNTDETIVHFVEISKIDYDLFVIQLGGGNEVSMVSKS